MLAEGSDLNRVVPFITRSFDNIKRFELNGNRLLGVVSYDQDEETLNLVEPIELQGYPEDWIDDVVDAIQKTLKQRTTSAYETRDTQDRFTWMASFPC